jgi:glycosyltransferase involved in cell wall biosynthesis
VPHRRLTSFRPITDADLPNADVVISTWWETAEWAAKLSPDKGAKAFFIQHYEAFEGLPKERVDAVWRLPFHKITISKWLAEMARDRFGDSDVSLVFNSVDTIQFYAPPRKRQTIPTIGFLHHNLRWKGVGVSLDAIRRVVAKIPKLRLLTFGTVPFDEELPSGVEHIHWKEPAQDFIRQIYSACDVWLCGSTSEGFHLPPLEAMACRCPVVSTQVGGPIDIVTPGINGFLAPIGDAEQLGQHLVTVLTCPEETWQHMSNAALATASAYTWEDATNLFKAGLLRAISRSKDGIRGL